MRNLQRILLCILLVVISASIALAAATSTASSCPSASSSTIPLGALSGSDADALAQTLSSIFHGEFVVAACADPKSSDDASSSTPAGPGADSASSSKHTLLAKSHDGSPANLQCASSNPSGCALKGLAASLDRDNFKGGALNSTYVVRVGNTEFAQKLVKYFAHPSPDIDVEPAINGYVAGCEDELSSKCEKTCKNQAKAEQAKCKQSCTEDSARACTTRSNSYVYLVLVPSSLVLGQSGAAKTLAQDAAGLKRDFEALVRYRNEKEEKQRAQQTPCPTLPNDPLSTAELCLAKNTILLSVLDPRDVALGATDLFDDQITVRVFPLNHSVAILPANYQDNRSASAIEQYELYRQGQKQKQLLASLQSGSTPSPSTSASPVTTTTTTVKTAVPAPSKSTSGRQSNAANTPSSTVSTSTTTSTTQPAAQAAGGSTGQGSSAAAPSSGGQGAGGTSAPGGGASGSASGTGTPGASAATAQAQPSQPSWGIDNIIRLYDYRDAVGIAAAINGMVSYVPNSRLIVQPLSDFGANDMLEILPSAAQQGGYSVGDIARAIALLDLPRPQLSLQVWSFQISAKVKNPLEPYKNHRRPCPKAVQSPTPDAPCADQAEGDDARVALENINRTVDEANRRMTHALDAGMETVFGAAQDPEFFDKKFREYLTSEYHDCSVRDQYCLGYFNALDYPGTSTEKTVVGGSLARLLLFLAASNDVKAQSLPADIIKNMQAALTEKDLCPGRCVCQFKTRQCGYFSRFAEQLTRVAEPANLHVLRAALLDFFFNYKWTLNYPNDFIPYDLSKSAHVLDDLLQPIDNAFNQDIDEYVQDELDNPNLIPATSKAGLTSQGMVQVAALSGTQATVSGQVSNYFNITQTPSLSQVAQSLLGSAGGGSGSGGGGAAAGGGGGGSGSGGGGQGSGASGGGGGSGAGGGTGGGGANGLQGLVSTNPYVVAGEALAGILAPPRITAQLTKGVTLIVTPTSLNTASSAELNVNLTVNEPDGGPQSVNTTAATQDLLDRVASHVVTDTVRVQSLKLFDLSTLSMSITHPRTPTCLPLAETQPARAFSYIAAVPFSVPCAVWRSTFGSIPMAGRLFEWPRPPITVDNRSVAIIRAVVVPTAMDLGLALPFENDRIQDPITGSTEALVSVLQLGWRARQFHKEMMRCVVNSQLACPTLSNVAEDLRNPSTN